MVEVGINMGDGLLRTSEAESSLLDGFRACLHEFTNGHVEEVKGAKGEITIVKTSDV